MPLETVNQIEHNQEEIDQEYLELRKERDRILKNREALHALVSSINRSASQDFDENYLDEIDNFTDTSKEDLQDIDSKLRIYEGGRVSEELINQTTPERERVHILNKEDVDMVRKDFAMALFKRGTVVNYEDEQWVVAGYDVYTGKAILKQGNDSESGERYTFAERIDLYLENREASLEQAQEFGNAQEAEAQTGVSPDEDQDMCADDHFDYERVIAEQEARQGEKLGAKFKNWAREKYEKFTKELDTLPVDIADALKSEKEPFKATVKDIWETVQRKWEKAKIDSVKEVESAKIIAKDIDKELTKGAEKFDRWVEGRRMAMGEALSDIKQANEFRAITQEMVKDLNKLNEFFGEETKLRKWMETDFDPMQIDDETLNGYYDLVEKARTASGLEATTNKGERREMYHLAFDAILKAKTATRDEIQKDMVTKTTEQLKQKMLSISPELNDNPEEVERRLAVFQEELNKEFGRLRQFQVAIDTKRMASLIRSLLDKDYWQGYVYGPLKIFQPRKEREVFKL